MKHVAEAFLLGIAGLAIGAGVVAVVLIIGSYLV